MLLKVIRHCTYTALLKTNMRAQELYNETLRAVFYKIYQQRDCIKHYYSNTAVLSRIDKLIDLGPSVTKHTIQFVKAVID